MDSGCNANPSALVPIPSAVASPSPEPQLQILRPESSPTPALPSAEPTPAPTAVPTPEPTPEATPGPPVAMGILLEAPKELSYRISFRRDLTALQLTPGAEATLLETRTRCRYRFSPEPSRRMRVALWVESQETVVYDLIDGQVSNERPATPAETGSELPEFIPVHLEASLRLNGELEAIHEPQGLSAYGQELFEQALVTYVRPFFSSYSVEVVRVGSTWPARSYLSGELTSLIPGSRVRQIGNPAWSLEASGAQNRLSYRGNLRYDLGSQTVTASETGSAVLDAATGLIDKLEFALGIASTSGAKIAPLVLVIEKL